MASLHLLFHLLLFLIPSAFAARGLAGGDGGKVILTPKVATLRYWSQKVPDGQPRPEFLVSKLSPLTVQNMAELQRLADGNALSTKLSAFCSWANLSCLPEVTAGQEKHAGPRLIRQVTDPSNNFDNGRKNHPDPYFYGRKIKEGLENQPNPYFYGRENHPNPYFYGRNNQEGQENQPNPYFYGRKNHPNPYFYGRKNHPNPYFYGQEDMEGGENQPIPYIYGGVNHPNPYFYGWGNKEGQENHQNPYIYSRENHPDPNSYVPPPPHPYPYLYGGENHPANAGAHSSHSLSAGEENMVFRESQLQEGKLVKMPDIKDKMPAHSFLPRSIAGKLPFTSSALSELLQVFKAGENSNLAYTMGDTLRVCEQEPSMGVIKRCVTSAEDMIDFAVDVVGPSATAKTTAGLGGSSATVQIGRVVKLNGGRVTKSVSCHQKPFPYAVYYCHSVPSVRVYEVDLLHQSTKAPINRGIAICHVDTSAWPATHFSFKVLGGEPGKIEICHWMSENDLVWVRAD